MTATLDSVALSRYRPYIESALTYANARHAYDDVAQVVSAGRAILWPGPDSMIVTEIVDYPRQRDLNFWLAAGKLPELEAMAPFILDWGKQNGCSHATLCGRRGWSRSFLARTGWTTSNLVLMERAL